MKRYSTVLVGVILLLATLACGTGGSATRRNNDIRRVALAYELSTRGAADELLVAFGLTEVRDNLGFEDGNTVWLNRFAKGEYFRKRDTSQTYLYLYDLNYEDGAASLSVDRGENDDVTTRVLSLREAGGAWEVIFDEPVDPGPAP